MCLYACGVLLVCVVCLCDVCRHGVLSTPICYSKAALPPRSVYVVEVKDYCKPNLSSENTTLDLKLVRNG